MTDAPAGFTRRPAGAVFSLLSQAEPTEGPVEIFLPSTLPSPSEPPTNGGEARRRGRGALDRDLALPLDTHLNRRT